MHSGFDQYNIESKESKDSKNEVKNSILVKSNEQTLF